MSNRKFLNLTLSIMMVVSLLLGGITQASAQNGQNIPGSTTDEAKVPHYFGPWPNWANSPLTLPDVQVVITHAQAQDARVGVRRAPPEDTDQGREAREGHGDLGEFQEDVLFGHGGVLS